MGAEDEDVNMLDDENSGYGDHFSNMPILTLIYNTLLVMTKFIMLLTTFSGVTQVDLLSTKNVEFDVRLPTRTNDVECKVSTPDFKAFEHFCRIMKERS